MVRPRDLALVLMPPAVGIVMVPVLFIGLFTLAFPVSIAFAFMGWIAAAGAAHRWESPRWVNATSGAVTGAYAVAMTWFFFALGIPGGS